MCVICLKPADQSPPDEDTLIDLFQSNPDGAGIAWATGDRVEISKGFLNLKGFLKVAKRVAKTHSDSAILYHCRIKTHGSISGENTHPYRVTKNLVMAHNGMLDIEIPKKSNASDTAVFVDRVVKRLPGDFLQRDEQLYLLDAAAGSGKLAFLKSDNSYVIVGESRGQWIDGLWFSNTYWIMKPEYRTISTKHGVSIHEPLPSLKGTTPNQDDDTDSWGLTHIPCESCGELLSTVAMDSAKCDVCGDHLAVDLVLNYFYGIDDEVTKSEPS